MTRSRKNKPQTPPIAETITLHITEVPRGTMDEIQGIGERMEPRVKRNDLIVWVLKQYAAGNLALQTEAEGALV